MANYLRIKARRTGSSTGLVPCMVYEKLVLSNGRQIEKWNTFHIVEFGTYIFYIELNIVWKTLCTRERDLGFSVPSCTHVVLYYSLKTVLVGDDINMNGRNSCITLSSLKRCVPPLTSTIYDEEVLK
jgi:hypothetical protein